MLFLWVQVELFLWIQNYWKWIEKIKLLLWSNVILMSKSSLLQSIFCFEHNNVHYFKAKVWFFQSIFNNFVWYLNYLNIYCVYKVEWITEIFKIICLFLFDNLSIKISCKFLFWHWTNKILRKIICLMCYFSKYHIW